MQVYAQYPAAVISPAFARSSLENVVSQTGLRPGVHVFYAGRDAASGRIGLYRAHYDGTSVSASNQIWSGDDMPNLVGAPCAVWDPEGAYAGDRLSRIHIFAPVEGNAVWWLSTTGGDDGPIVHNMGVSFVRTSNKPGVVLYDNVMRLYYSDAASKRVTQAYSTGSWDMQGSAPLAIDGSPAIAASGCAATLRWVPHVVFGQPTDIPPFGNLPVGPLRLVYLTDADPSEPGSGTWVENSPAASSLTFSPSASVLGGDIVIAHRAANDDGRIYVESISSAGGWSSDERIPDAWTTNSPGCCVWGDRLYCFFQASQDQGLYVTAYVGNAWLPHATQVSGPDNVFWGPVAVAVGP